jgi:bifunctional UDP-N-acetylglucosamine pyrophosphorylase/glucosamine-1-phosphate N-acetyltransferase
MDTKIASLILAAGRGSRMKEFDGNKTLLPLVTGNSSREDSHPILLEILSNLPSGPKAIVVNYKKEDIISATRDFSLTYCEQPKLNGTGGALLAAIPFLKKVDCEHLIITMGDVPLVKKDTYRRLIQRLKNNSMAILGFRPKSKREYGVLETDADYVKRIIEWKYWKDFPKERQEALHICNSGIYASKREDLLKYLPVLSSRPHKVLKKISGKAIEVEEYFITDLVEYMNEDGLSVGFIIAEDEKEVMGVDDITALYNAREIFIKRSGNANLKYDG